MITLKQLAKKLGVSHTTVSNVVNGKTSEVSQKTINIVQQAIEEFDYIPNRNAKSLSEKRTKIIGVVIQHPIIDNKNAMEMLFYSEIVGSIEYHIRKNDLHMLLHSSDEVTEIINFTKSWNVDGLILISFRRDDAEIIKKSIKKPTVYVDSLFFNSGDFINVTLNDRISGYNMTNYLIGKGHRKIGFFQNCIDGPDKQRYLGYSDAMNEHGYSFKKSPNLCGFSEGQIYKKLNELVKEIENYSALFFSSDYLAAVAINYFFQKGLDVPRDVSVCGFDDNIYATLVRPQLTTVKQDPKVKGELAVNILIELLDKGKVEKNNYILETEIITRDSVRTIGK